MEPLPRPFNVSEADLAYWRAEAERLRGTASGIGERVARVHELLRALGQSKDLDLLTDDILHDIDAVCDEASQRQIRFAEQADEAQGKANQIAETL